jgi:hypothetical protein
MRITATENIAAVHSDQLDAVKAAVRQLRDDAEAVTKINDLLIKSVPMLAKDDPVETYCRIACVNHFGNN